MPIFYFLHLLSQTPQKRSHLLFFLSFFTQFFFSFSPSSGWISLFVCREKRKMACSIFSQPSLSTHTVHNLFFVHFTVRKFLYLDNRCSDIFIISKIFRNTRELELKLKPIIDIQTWTSVKLLNERTRKNRRRTVVLDVHSISEWNIHPLFEILRFPLYPFRQFGRNFHIACVHHWRSQRIRIFGMRFLLLFTLWCWWGEMRERDDGGAENLLEWDFYTTHI